MVIEVRIAIALVGGLIGKGQEESFWGDGNGRYLNLGYCCIGVEIQA